MKKLILPLFILTGLLAMSFTTPKAFKIDIIQTLDGQQLTNVDILTIEDLQLLEEMTISGASESSVVHTKVIRDILDRTITKHKDGETIDPGSRSQEKLDMILAKYN